MSVKDVARTIASLVGQSKLAINLRSIVPSGILKVKLRRPSHRRDSLNKQDGCSIGPPDH